MDFSLPCKCIPPLKLECRVSQNEKTAGLESFKCDQCGLYKLKRDVKAWLEALYNAKYKCKKADCGNEFYAVKEAGPRSTRPGCKYAVCSKNSCGGWIVCFRPSFAYDLMVP